MNLIRIFLMFLVFLMPIVTQSAQCSDFNYDDIRENFNDLRLNGCVRIAPSGNPLTDPEKQGLINSQHLGMVHTLSFANQGIDDDFIGGLSNYSSLCKIINLDLSGNLDITMDSINYILESDILGSLRDLPQVSGRYGCPSSTIYINARGTNVESPDQSNYVERHRSGFSINYNGRFPTVEGVKFVEVWLD